MMLKQSILAMAVAGLAFAAPAMAQEAPAPAAAPHSGRLFAVLLEPGPAWKPGRPFREQGLLDHFNYWMKLFRDGRIVTAGPLGDDGGLVLLRAAGQADADAILAADPALAAGIFTGTVRPYAPPMVNADALRDDRAK
jgi:uncharacterized protein YciI